MIRKGFQFSSKTEKNKDDRDFNDLPECLKCATARMYANDTTITNSHKSKARRSPGS